MNQTRAKIYLLVLVLAFFGLLISQVIKPEPSSQPKQQVAQKASDEQGKVLAGGGPTCYLVDVKDATTNKAIADATVTFISPRGTITAASSTAGWNFVYSTIYINNKAYKVYGFYCNEGYAGAPNATISVSKSGYQTKTATIPTGFPVPSWDTVALSLLDTNPPSAPSNLKTTNVKPTSATLSWTASTDNKAVTGYKIFRDNVQIYTTTGTSFTDSSLKADKKYSYFVKAYDAAGNVSGASNTVTVTTTLTIKDVSLPKVFGGTSTNLAKISDPKKVKNLTIEVKGKNKVVWNEIVDLSSQDTANKFKSLNKYLKAEKLGIVELDSKSLKVLNKRATVTMFNLPFVSTPRVLVDGKEDPEVVSDVSYEDGTLAFKAAHFTKFEAVPILTISEPTNGFTTNDPQITLKGTTSDPEATISATLNNQSLGDLKVATQSGQFSKDLTLAEGTNTIIVEANSLFGATLSATINGEYSPNKFNGLWAIGGVAVLVIFALAGGGYYWYKKERPR